MPISRASRPSRASFLATVTVALAASAALAQSGKITGRVVDQGGGPLGFVDVFLEGTGTNYLQSRHSDDAGAFAFHAVPVGTYELYAFSMGLVSEKITRIVLARDSHASFNVALRPPSGASDVTVVVEAPKIDFVDPRDPAVSWVVTGDFIANVPLQNKRIQHVLKLVPGVIASGSSDSTEISVSGGASTQIGYRVDGASINDQLDGGARFDIPTAAIEQVKLTTTGNSAKIGEHSTGTAEIVTKRGTNQFKFSYGVNFRDTHYGAGPLDDLDSSLDLVDELLRGAGTRLESEIQQGFQLLGVGRTSTREDDNDLIPRRRVRHTISAGGPIVRDEVFFHATLESLADDYGSAFVRGTDKNDQLLFTGKLNWDISAKQSLEASLSSDVQEDSGFAAIRAPVTVDTDGSSGSWTLGLTHQYILSAAAFLESRLTLGHDYETERPTTVRTGVGTSYQVPLPPGGPTSWFVGAAGSDFDETVDTIRIEETFTREFRKRHTFETGVTFSNVAFHSFTEEGDSVTDFRVVNDANVIGDPGAFVGRLTETGPPVRTDDSTWSAAFFVQDKWLVSDRFTLDFGLRGDYQEFVKELFVAPRFGFSLDPIGDGRTKFHGTWGLYHDNLFAAALQWTSNPDLFYSDIFFLPQFTGGVRRFSQTPITTIYKEALVTPINSRDPDAVASLQNTFHDRFRTSPDISAPVNAQWSLGIERELPAHVRLAIGYTENHRRHQPRQVAHTVAVPGISSPFTVRDRVYETSGHGQFRQWTVALQRAFSRDWEAQVSYSQQQNRGPIAPPSEPLDPTDVVSSTGLLGNDRTHVVKGTGFGKLPWKIAMSGDFTWQTGLPTDAEFLTGAGSIVRPFGRNTIRNPSTRQLNFQLRRPFETADGKLSVTAEVSVYNLLNEMNVTGGFGRFALPEGLASDPEQFPPLRPEIVPTDFDVSRSLEFGLTLAF